jgi:hypothetical protein
LGLADRIANSERQTQNFQTKGISAAHLGAAKGIIVERQPGKKAMT